MTARHRAQDELGTYDVVYVSPHLDDAAYSCAAHINFLRQRNLRVLVLTVFSAGDDGTNAVCNEFSDVAARRAEDEACMRAMGVDWHYAGFEEAVFRHGVATKSRCLPLHLSRMFCSAWFCASRSNASVVDRLTAYLDNLVRCTNCRLLIGPAGIGMHPDHLLVHRAVENARASLVLSGSKTMTWMYYDWPYCSFPLLVKARLSVRRFKDWQTITFGIDAAGAEARKRAVGTYRSQVKPVFGNDLSMKAALDTITHERFLVPPAEAKLLDTSFLPSLLSYVF